MTSFWPRKKIRLPLPAHASAPVAAGSSLGRQTRMSETPSGAPFGPASWLPRVELSRASSMACCSATTRSSMVSYSSEPARKTGTSTTSAWLSVLTCNVNSMSGVSPSVKAIGVGDVARPNSAIDGSLM